MPSIKLWAGALAAWALLGLGGSAARAEFLSAFSGNTQMSDAVTSPSAGVRGVVSFSVFLNNSPDFVAAMNAALGLSSSNQLTASTVAGGGTIDLDAKYVYLYQVVNTAPTGVGGPSIQTLEIANPSNAFTSAGYFFPKAFRDNPDGAVGIFNTQMTNTGLGTDPTSDDVAGDSTPSLSGETFVDAGGDDTITTFANPKEANLVTGGNPITFTFSGDDLITPHRTSTIVFLTSNVAPGYAVGKIGDAAVTTTKSDGDIPSAVVPEPGSLVLCGLGVGLLGFYGWRRRGLNAQPAIA
jgi:hypothetical protein